MLIFFSLSELLSGGADPGLVDRTGQRPLDIAAALGNHQLVEVLVEGGAPALESALLSACRAGRNTNAGHVEAVRSLMRLGVNVNCRDSHGLTPAELVQASGGSQELLDLLASKNKVSNKSGGFAKGVKTNVKSQGYGAVVGSNSSNNNNNNNNNNNMNVNNNNSKNLNTVNVPEKDDGDSEERKKDEDAELSNVVHIGSLPSIPGGTLWEAIKTTMSKYGTVRQVRMTPKSTFAFVEYDTVQEAVRAIEECEGFVNVHGSKCTVSWATKRKRKGRKQKPLTPAGAESGVVAPLKKKNACNIFMDTGHCSWGSKCKYSHDANARRVTNYKHYNKHNNNNKNDAKDDELSGGKKVVSEQVNVEQESDN